MSFGRVTFFIADGKFSWTETYYAVNQNIGLPDLMTQAGHLAGIRTSLMPNYLNDASGKTGVSLEEIRVSLDDTWRDSLINTDFRRGGKSGSYPKFGTITTRPERPYSVLLLRMDGSQGGLAGQYRRVLYLSGVPESVIGDPEGPNIFNPPSWGLSLGIFMDELSQKPAAWGFKVRAKGVTAKEFPVTKVTFNLVGGTADIIVPGGQFPDPTQTLIEQYLLIRNARFTPPQRGINGMRQYLLTPNPPPAVGNVPDGYTLLRTAGEGAYEGKGKARLLVYTITPIDSVVVDTETHRKRGVRSLAPLGRSPKRSTSG